MTSDRTYRRQDWAVADSSSTRYSAFSSGNGHPNQQLRCGSARFEQQAAATTRVRKQARKLDPDVYPMCPAVDFVIMEWVQNAYRPQKYGICSVVPPTGFEPALPPPEGGALSPELRGRAYRWAVWQALLTRVS